jgi:hypothetical protein
MVCGQTATRPRSLADDGEGGTVDAALGDHLGGRGQQGTLGFLAPFDLGPPHAHWRYHPVTVQNLWGVQQGSTCCTLNK